MPNTREIELWKLVHNAFQNSINKFGDIFSKDVTRDLLDNGVTVQKWIPVSERLPDRGDMVIVFYPTMRGTSGEMQIHKAWAMSETCTHWMPLPEPPKGE